MAKIQGESKKELDEKQTEYSLIVPDEYLVEVEEIEDKIQPKYMKPDQTEEVLNVQFKIVSTRDGENAKDEDGEDATGRKLFFTANVESLGFKKDGTPSKARQFLWHIVGADIYEENIIDDTNKLLGKQIYAEVIKKENQKGQMTNRIVGFKKVKETKETKKDIPVIDDGEIDVSKISY